MPPDSRTTSKGAPATRPAQRDASARLERELARHTVAFAVVHAALANVALERIRLERFGAEGISHCQGRHA
jgi:hypothetical protein